MERVLVGSPLAGSPRFSVATLRVVSQFAVWLRSGARSFAGSSRVSSQRSRLSPERPHGSCIASASAATSSSATSSRERLVRLDRGRRMTRMDSGSASGAPRSKILHASSRQGLTWVVGLIRNANIATHQMDNQVGCRRDWDYNCLFRVQLFYRLAQVYP